jgi:chromosome segregation ATPase
MNADERSPCIKLRVAIMSLSDMFRKSAVKPGDEFPEMQEAMAGLIDLELDAPSLEMHHAEGVEPNANGDKGAASGPVETAFRLTAYAQSRLAALKAFDELHRNASVELDQLSAALTRVNAAHHSTREFLSSLHTSVYRANEIEIAHDALVAENRKLTQQVEQVKRLRAQHESLIEAYKRREAKLTQDCDALKVDLGRVGLEANDALSRAAALEAERADLLNTFAVKSSTAERHARENEILREKQINLSLDLEHAERRQTEMERKFDELTAIRNGESAQLAEARARLSASEKESYRQQKQHDALEAQLEEMQDRLQAAEAAADESAKHHETQVQKLKSEVETLKARLEAAGKAHVETSDELGAVKQRLADTAGEKKIAEDRLAALKQEYEAERQANAAHEAHEAVEQDAEASVARGAEVEKLRREVERLKTTVRKLSPYERMYKKVKARREQASPVGANGADGAAKHAAPAA